MFKFKKNQVIKVEEVDVVRMSRDERIAWFELTDAKIKAGKLSVDELEYVERNVYNRFVEQRAKRKKCQESNMTTEELNARINEIFEISYSKRSADEEAELSLLLRYQHAEMNRQMAIREAESKSHKLGLEAFKRGQIAYRLGDLSEALFQFEKAVATTYSYGSLYEACAIVYREFKMYDEELRLIDKFVNEHADHPNDYFANDITMLIKRRQELVTLMERERLAQDENHVYSAMELAHITIDDVIGLKMAVQAEIDKLDAFKKQVDIAYASVKDGSTEADAQFLAQALTHFAETNELKLN